MKGGGYYVIFYLYKYYNIEQSSKNKKQTFITKKIPATQYRLRLSYPHSGQCVVLDMTNHLIKHLKWT